MEKPGSKADLVPDFRYIGEQHWADRMRAILQRYDISLPEPVTEASLIECEQSENIDLPAPLRTFLKEIGPVNFDGIQIYHPSDMHRLEQYGSWLDQEEYRDALTREQRTLLSTAIGIGEDASTDLIALIIDTGQCYLCSHDPAGLYWGISFSDLIQIAVIDLSWSYYGWPDVEIEIMASELKRDMFGDIFKT